MYVFTFNLMCNTTFFRKKIEHFFPSRGRKHVKGSNICFHCVLCFIPVYMKDNFLKKKILLTPSQVSTVYVRAYYLLTCYCIFHFLSFDMQQVHMLEMMMLYKSVPVGIILTPVL